MKHRNSPRVARPKILKQLPSIAPISAAVFLALYGVPRSSHAADQTSNEQEGPLAEIIVTASHRNETTEQVPYAISVVTPDDIARNSVTDLSSLFRQQGVAGSSDAHFSASDFPIIRGLNASPSTTIIRIQNQAPVGTYIGNSPIDGYFQLQDIQRVEILRGPQGTLYGAGSLGGALRVIPNDPVLGKFSGDIDGRVGYVDHAGSPSYTTTGMVNLPIGDTLAFRAAANYEYEPGYVDVYGLLERSGPLGTPVLADPSDPVNSSGVFTGKKDWNDAKAFTGRTSLLWKPVSSFSAELAFNYSDASGDAGPQADPLYKGGPYINDPRITFPAGGDFQAFAATDAPYQRKTELTSLDLSYDAGFATLSSTTSYFTNGGSETSGVTYGLLTATLIPYVPYYAGNPINPRWIAPLTYTDSEHTFSQEVRLVSATGPDKIFDYTVGVYYEKQTRNARQEISSPGTLERAQAQGCTGNYFFGATFPNCLVQVGPNELAGDLQDSQHFTDKSEFGELTYHFAKNWQVTAGVRHFEQSFTDIAGQALYDFGLVQPAVSQTSPASKTLGKVDLSWEYLVNQHVYALWSQGFRRGGANGLLLKSGAFADEAPTIYQPDSVNNYEFGFKGHLQNGLSYSIDAFDIFWSHPQIAGLTPDSNFAVWNAPRAKSTGMEFNLNTPLFVPDLVLMLGGTYANARLTETYSIPDYFGPITGTAGEQLPGSPKTSAAATLLYGFNITPSYRLSLSLNNTYTSSVPTTYFSILGIAPTKVPSIDLVNASANLTRGPWRAGIFVTNLTNKYEILGRGLQDPTTEYLSYTQSFNPPREIYMRVGYSF
jgi:iron complex outermembrane receptor protein